MSGGRAIPRLALGALIAAAAAAAIVLLSDGERANGGPTASEAAKGWTRLAASPLSRTEVGAARIDNFIYVVGGFQPPGGDTSAKVARYDIDAGTWQQLADMPIGVNHPAVAALGGRLFVHGGYRDDASLSGESDALQVFDPASGAWSQLAPSGVPRGAHTLVAGRGLLFAIGGAQTGKALTLTQIYDPASNSWRTGAPMPTGREHIAGARVKDRIYVLGGREIGI
jgi:N-acetylneuraminic acid mutarotase